MSWNVKRYRMQTVYSDPVNTIITVFTDFENLGVHC